MTRAELLIAAARAERYPPGIAVHWGAGPLLDLAGDALALALGEHPEWLEHG